MFELSQLEQLIAISEYKTLSKAAEELNISQPALSRSIQRLEEELGLTLFDRQKNRMSLNEDGEMALEYAKRILDLSHEMKKSLVDAEKARRTISIGSLAPAPLWSLTPVISQLFPELTILTEMESEEVLERGLREDKYQIIITKNTDCEEDMEIMDYCEEDLYVSLPPAHPLAQRPSVSLSDLNGQSFLQYSKVGFWLEICKRRMPDSLFLMQDEMFALNELRKSSALPSFATNLTGNGPENEHRVLIPITDDEVNVIFYLKYKKKNRKYFRNIQPLS